MPIHSFTGLTAGNLHHLFYLVGWDCGFHHYHTLLPLLLLLLLHHLFLLCLHYLDGDILNAQKFFLLYVVP